jgi:hypothetical protein
MSVWLILLPFDRATDAVDLLFGAVAGFGNQLHGFK